jgi:hypothetical protein
MPAITPRAWIGPEPHDLHRLLLAACSRPSTAAHAAWERWLAACEFDDEDPASYELAGLAVARLGPAAGTGPIVARCRGWNRRAWMVSTMADEVVGRIREFSRHHGIDVSPVGDVLTFEVGPSFADRPFPIRAIELQVHNGSPEDIEALHAVAMQGTASIAIRSGQLPVSLRTDYPHRLLTRPGGRIAWLVSRNWRRYPVGRTRWVLELMGALSAVADPHRLAVEVADAAQQLDTLAAVREALDWLGTAELADERVRILRTAVAARPRSIRSRLRLWRVRHPWPPNILRRQ